MNARVKFKPGKAYIYALHAGDNRFVYVGCSDQPFRRVWQHANSSNRALSGWFKSSPEVRIKILDTVAPKEARRAEHRWMLRLEKRGFSLVNTAGLDRPFTGYSSIV